MTFEKKKKAPRIISNDRYQPDDKPCEGNCAKCMFRNGCSRKHKEEVSPVVIS
jgi:hypothetical protein